LRFSIKNISLTRLKKRSEFIRVASARLKRVTPGLILQGRKHTLKEIESSKIETLRLGFTVSKKVGNAVVRNRVKRRLKAAAQAILPIKAPTHVDLVIIGRQNTLKRPFPDLLADLKNAVGELQLHKSET
jgi:ribonuclease P protein component